MLKNARIKTLFLPTLESHRALSLIPGSPVSLRSLVANPMAPPYALRNKISSITTSTTLKSHPVLSTEE
jgi:hypothetical protein